MSSRSRQRLASRPGRPALASRVAVASVFLLGFWVAFTAVPAATAHAHGRVSEYATDVDSRLTTVPELDGVRWRIHSGGLLIEVENRGPEELVVPGYDGEPYLRVGPDGVFENRRSPATYLNADRYAEVAVPPVADPVAAPEWIRTSATPRAVWHDHRAHWMSAEPPDRLQRQERGQPLAKWELPFRYGEADHVLAGELLWAPAPAPWPSLGLAALVVAPGLVGLLGLRGSASATGTPGRSGQTRSTGSVRRRLLRPAALMVGAVALANAVHLADEVLAHPAPALDVAVGLFHTGLFVGTGLIGAIIATRGRGLAPAALAAASGALLFHQGLLHLPALAAGVLPTALPDPLFRLLVAASLVQSLPVLTVLIADRRARRNEIVSLVAGRPTHRSRDVRPSPQTQETSIVSLND